MAAALTRGEFFEEHVAADTESFPVPLSALA